MLVCGARGLYLPGPPRLGSDMRALLAYAPAATMMLVSIISYVDRNTLALLAPTILKETGLSMRDYGLAVSAYSV